jgi:phage tail sheath protein FI
MPPTLTYPGVYVEEIPSGVHPITGVATSITAFIGRALRGPTDEPVTITSYGDFVRLFGGLWLDSGLGYAVQDFYLNGGSTAIVVRVHNSAGAGDTASLKLDTLTLAAASPGEWGSHLTATIDHEVVTGGSDATLFNLAVTDGVTAVVETFRNVSLQAGSPRRVDLVLAAQSRLVVVSGSSLPSAVADVKDVKATGGGNGSPIDHTVLVGDTLKTGKTGLYALDKADLVNLVVIPPYKGDPPDVEQAVIDAAIDYAAVRRAVVIVDPTSAWTSVDTVVTGKLPSSLTTSQFTRNAAVYFPRVRRADPLRDGRIGTFAASGAVAGVISRTDAARGVWKAPAGLEAVVSGTSALDLPLTDAEIGQLNPLGVNCLRATPDVGITVWGARTRDGDDKLTSEWKYLPVRRTALFLEESLFRGTQWVVFEPNDAPLWAQIRLNVGAFMSILFRQGAFAGTTSREAFFVKCDAETTTQDDVDRGVVNIVVGFAPLKPAEFVVIQLSQIAGQTGGA